MAIIFIFLVFLAWILYLRQERVYTMVIFFFFLTSGFQLIPEETMSLMTGFSKGTDYALVLMAGCIGINFIFSKGRYLRTDGFFFWMCLFLAFLVICILYSVSSGASSIKEAIQVSRQYFLVLSYLIFRNMTKEELKRLLIIVFYVSLVISCLYILQAILSTAILVGASYAKLPLGDFVIHRYYNQPLTLYLCTFLAMYTNLTRGGIRLFSLFIFLTAIVLGFNRSGTGCFLIVWFLGYVLHLSKVKQVRFTVLIIAISVPAIVVWGHNFMKTRTYEDIQALIDGRYADSNIDLYAMYSSTFAYRAGHLFERINYLEENPTACFVGAGLIPEDSPAAGKFNFILGLQNEKTGLPYQLETPDITYSALFMRFGYLGSAIFMMLYIYMLYFFFRNRSNQYAFTSFLFLTLSIGISFFSSNLLFPVYFVMPLLMMNLVSKELDFEKENRNEENILEIGNS